MKWGYSQEILHTGKKTKYKMKNLPLIFSAVIVGIILFQSVLVAPAINKLINTIDASTFLRFIWPKFFIIIAIISLVSFILMIINAHPNLYKYFSFISFLLMLSCYLITPLINEAKDSLNEQLWTILHLSTIILTLLTLTLNVVIILCWKSTN